MALHKGITLRGFLLPNCEKHFHDYDETWIVVSGTGTSYWIDHQGKREEFLLEKGDAWMIPAGYEHGTDGFGQTGKNSDDFAISVFTGTLATGAQPPGHYYVEKERYLPTLELKRNPTERYG